ncbi:MAG: hypothetical protein L3J41_00910 [Melioribacteraceae bacterium]|nr:hypothetical protein [Melioribacteraceae bacterium]
MKTLKIFILLLASLSLFSCQENFLFIDDTPPPVPTNIITETGDDFVIISWDHIYDTDFSGYAVYYSDKYDGEYKLIGTTVESNYVDYGAANGVTYYYAVASYDYSGNESDLSYDVAYDTPRPEGYDQSVYDFINFPNIAGYDFSKYSIDKYNSLETDFFFENDDGTFYLNVWEDTDIQSMGRTTDIYSISFAPTDGWVELKPGDNIKYLQAIRGNTYVIRTWDNHFAKIRISEIFADHIVFDWAYQTAEGNVELKINRNNGERVLPEKVNVNRNIIN